MVFIVNTITKEVYNHAKQAFESTTDVDFMVRMVYNDLGNYSYDSKDDELFISDTDQLLKDGYSYTVVPIL